MMPHISVTPNRPSYQAKAELLAAIEKRRIERLHKDLADLELAEAMKAAHNLLREQHLAEVRKLAKTLVENGTLDKAVELAKQARKAAMSVGVSWDDLP